MTYLARRNTVKVAFQRKLIEVKSNINRKFFLSHGIALETCFLNHKTKQFLWLIQITEPTVNM
jgi:hypothetical protein